MLSMSIYLRNALVFREAGYFSTYLAYDHQMVPGGFQVECGDAGVGGNPEFGDAYTVTVRAESNEQSSNKTANFATLYCPVGDKTTRKKKK